MVLLSAARERPRSLWPALAAPGALALVALFWLVWIGRSPLFFDEAYYWDWSRHLDLGYLDHPPLVAWLIRLTTSLAGTSEFAVRLGMVACGVGTVALAYKAGTLLGGALAGWLCLAMAASCPLFGLLFSFAAPDASLLLLWAGTVYALLLAVSGEHRCWYVAGVLLGLALLAKYTAFLLVPSLLLFVVLSRYGWARRREPYLAGALALLVWSPNLWWNVAHDWQSARFQWTHGACVSAARSANYLEQTGAYAGNQLSLVGPLLAIALIAATIMAVLDWRRHGQDAPLLLACSTMVIAMLFFLLHGVRHWAAPGYFSAIVCAGVYLARLIERLPAGRRRWPALACAAVIVAGYVESAGLQVAYIERTTAANGGSGLLIDVATGIDGSLLRAQPRWSSATRMVASVVSGLRPAERRSVVLVGDTYSTTAELAFYLPGQPQVYSGSNQYRLWEPRSGAGSAVLFVAWYANGDLPFPLTAGIPPAATLPVSAGGKVTGRVEVTVLPNPHGATLRSLLASTESRPLRCQ